MAYYIALAGKLERAARCLLILEGVTADTLTFANNGDCFVSNDSRTRKLLPNRTCIVGSTDPMRRHRPESILHLQIQHHLKASLESEEEGVNPEMRRVEADNYLGDTADTLGLSELDNDDIMQPLADALTNYGRWLATPSADPLDKVAAGIVANNGDMVNFRVDWIRRAHPFHTRGHDAHTANWVEILHFEAGCSYASNGP